jgi:hypothetical protein
MQNIKYKLMSYDGYLRCHGIGHAPEELKVFQQFAAVNNDEILDELSDLLHARIANEARCAEIYKHIIKCLEPTKVVLVREYDGWAIVCNDIEDDGLKIFKRGISSKLKAILYAKEKKWLIVK